MNPSAKKPKKPRILTQVTLTTEIKVQTTGKVQHSRNFRYQKNMSVKLLLKVQSTKES